MSQFYTYKKGVPLKQGETLHFKTGKGYYAGPAVTRVRPRVFTPPSDGGYAPGGVSYYNPPGAKRPQPAPRRPLPKPPIDPMAPRTQQEIDDLAAKQAQGELDPQEAEIRRQQAEAARQAAAQQAAIQGFSVAAAQLEGQMAPEISAGYHTATEDIGKLGEGIASGVANDVKGAQDAGSAFGASQGQDGGAGVDTGALHDVTYALSGEIPGESLAARGAAATADAAGVPQIQLNAGRQQLEAAMSQAKQTNDDYAQQLIQVAAQYPNLKAQALQALNQYEIDKAQYRESVRENKANDALQLRAEKANERAAGIGAETDAAKLNAEYTYKYAALRFQSQKAADAAKAAAKAGKTIDVGASRLMGHVVYKDGTEDKSLKVAKSTSANTPASKAKQNKSNATTAAATDAFKYGTQLLGTPAVTRKQYAKGRYDARPGAKGVFSDRTTNNPNKAVREGAAADFADAQNKVWAYIGGDALMARYGLSHEQVMSIVNRALVRAGWKRKATKKPKTSTSGAAAPPRYPKRP